MKVQNGDIVFIDLTNCGIGHPVFEMTSMCMTYHMDEIPGGKQDNPLLRNFTDEERGRIWTEFIC